MVRAFVRLDAGWFLSPSESTMLDDGLMPVAVRETEGIWP